MLPIPTLLPPIERLEHALEESRPATVAEQVQTSQVAPDLTVQWTKMEAIQVDRLIRPGLFANGASEEPDTLMQFSGGVTAIYGVTTLRADRLAVLRGGKRGFAEGAVRIDDPDGKLQASDLAFDWGNRTGFARGVRAEIANLFMTAQEVDIGTERWVLRGVRASTCGREKPLYAIRIPEVRLTPGKGGRTTGTGLEVFGKYLGKGPGTSFSLDKRVLGLRLPMINHRKGQGLGVSWFSGILLNESTSISAAYATYPRQPPGYGITLVKSSIGADEARGLLAPRSELNEWFNRRYMDNIDVQTPKEEVLEHRAKRESWSIGSYGNQSARGRAESLRIKKPIEFAYERGGPLGRGGYQAQVRLHQIADGEAPAYLRGLVWVNAAHRGPDLGPIKTLVGLDAMGFLGGGTKHAWARLQTTAVYEQPNYRFAVGYTVGVEGGRPLFDFDALPMRRSLHARADANIGPLTASYLVKWDGGTMRMIDKEYILALKVGCLEPFVRYRQFPSESSFGIRFSIDQFTRVLQRRTVTRPSESKRDDW